MPDDLTADGLARKQQQQANQASFRKVGLFALVFGGLADGLSTNHALKQPGLHESNPMLGKNPSGAKIWTVKGVGAIAQSFLLDKVAKDKPKLAKFIAITFGALQLGAAANNMRLANKAGQKK